uniref:Uncharacterized protein n=1 Tax=Glossina austeni TaxID=7395 RepID=A0A1A9V3G2_GLOAU
MYTHNKYEVKCMNSNNAGLALLWVHSLLADFNGLIAIFCNNHFCYILRNAHRVDYTLEKLLSSTIFSENDQLLQSLKPDGTQYSPFNSPHQRRSFLGFGLNPLRMERSDGNIAILLESMENC